MLIRLVLLLLVSSSAIAATSKLERLWESSEYRNSAAALEDMCAYSGRPPDVMEATFGMYCMGYVEGVYSALFAEGQICVTEDFSTELAINKLMQGLRIMRAMDSSSLTETSKFAVVRSTMLRL